MHIQIRLIYTFRSSNKKCILLHTETQENILYIINTHITFFKKYLSGRPKKRIMKRFSMKNKLLL